jgi:hypothetical protein
VKTETAAHKTEREKLQTQPVVFARFSHLKKYGDGTDFPFSVDFSTDAVLSPTKTKKPWLLMPQGNTQTIEPELGRSSIGVFPLSLLDAGGEVLRYLSNPTLTLKTAMTPTVPSAGGFVEATEATTGYPGVGTLEVATGSVTPAAPTATAGAAGNVDVGTHSWVVTFVISGAEHRGGPKSNVVTITTSAKQVDLSAIATGPTGTTARKIYRTAAGDTGGHKLVGTVPDNTTVTFTDNIADASLGAEVPGALERVRYDQNDTVNKRFRVATGGRGADSTVAADHAVGVLIANGEQIRPGQRCQLFSGYAAIAEVEYTAWPKFEVLGRGLAGGRLHTVQLTDIQRSLRRRVFLTATAKVPRQITANPVTAALRVLTSTGLGTNGPYDVLIAEDGLAVPQALVDVAGLERLRDTEFPAETYDFKITEPVDGKGVLEEEIWRTLNAYPWVAQDGKYSARRYRPGPYYYGGFLAVGKLVATAG